MKDFLKKYGGHVAGATMLSTIFAAIFAAVIVGSPDADVSPLSAAVVAWIVLTAVFNLIAVNFFPHNPSDKGQAG